MYLHTRYFILTFDSSRFSGLKKKEKVLKTLILICTVHAVMTTLLTLFVINGKIENVIITYVGD